MTDKTSLDIVVEDVPMTIVRSESAWRMIGGASSLPRGRKGALLIRGAPLHQVRSALLELGLREVLALPESYTPAELERLEDEGFQVYKPKEAFSSYEADMERGHFYFDEASFPKVPDMIETLKLLGYEFQ